MSYKKRAKSGWRTGKCFKEQANRDERGFGKREVEKEIAMDREDYRVGGKNKAKISKLKELRNKLKGLKNTLAKWEGRDDWWGAEGIISRTKDSINKTNKQIEVELEKSKTKS